MHILKAKKTKPPPPKLFAYKKTGLIIVYIPFRWSRCKKKCQKSNQRAICQSWTNETRRIIDDDIVYYFGLPVVFSKAAFHGGMGGHC